MSYLEFIPHRPQEKKSQKDDSRHRNEPSKPPHELSGRFISPPEKDKETKNQKTISQDLQMSHFIIYFLLLLGKKTERLKNESCHCKTMMAEIIKLLNLFDVLVKITLLCHHN